MVRLEPRHVALWQKAAPHCTPSTVATKPTYGAWHRQRAEKRRDGPTIEQADDGTPRDMAERVSDGE